MAGNFGPDKKQALDMGQTHTVSVRPGGYLRCRFSFNAYHENAVLIYTADSLEEVARRANAFYVNDEDWEFENESGADAGFVITGWHKDASYEPSLPWHQSRIKVHFQTDKVGSVGFEDSPNDADFNDALVTVNIWPPSPPPKPRPPLRTYVYVGLAAAFVAGTALGLWVANPRIPWRSAGTQREGRDHD